MDARHAATRRVRTYWRLSVLINLLWFAFPVHDLVVGDHTAAGRAAAATGLAVFAALYVPAVLTAWFRPDAAPDPFVRIAGCTALGIALTVGAGSDWTTLIIYSAHLAAATIRRRIPEVVAVVAVIAAATSGTAWAVGGPGWAVWAGAYTLLVGLYAVAFGQVVVTYGELDRARSDLARLAVADERLRFARDLHDLLGHSLSVIALKSELAGRLIASDPARATTEVHDIEAVTREALAEVRQTVSGYRGSADLAAELDRARSALVAAGVDAEIDEPPDLLPAEVESLLAWTVREGTTNIVRHAGARRATIRLHGGRHGAGVELVDDGGRGATPDGSGPAVGAPAGSAVAAGGNGLDGLAERVSAAAGALEAGATPGGGFRLAVRVPR